MKDYILALIEKHQPVNPLHLYACVTRDKNYPYNRSTLPHDLLTILCDLDDEEKIKYTDKGIVIC